jgi:hypothetical protein
MKTSHQSKNSVIIEHKKKYKNKFNEKINKI